jgi:hypothetical protein
VQRQAAAQTAQVDVVAAAVAVVQAGSSQVWMMWAEAVAVAAAAVAAVQAEVEGLVVEVRLLFFWLIMVQVALSGIAP